MDSRQPVAIEGTDFGLRQAFDALTLAYRQEPYPDWQTRQRRLRRMTAALRAQQAPLAAAINQDFGQRSPVETQFAELFPALEGLRHARHQLKSWMKPQRRGVSRWFFPARNCVVPQPLGVVGIIVPWNYPLYLALGPLTAAVAAGNRVMIKMSELTPRFGALLAALLHEALGQDLVRVFNGPVALAEAFGRLPFDHLLFTGSTPVGRQVMRVAAENLTPVTLELGGKSPVIVAPDADLARAAASIVAGKMLNAGQTCVAPDYVLVPRARRAELVQALIAEATRAYPTLASNPDLSAIINQRHYARLCAWLEQARARGAQLASANSGAEDLAAVRKMPLTVVWQCPDECELMRQEIFGPILPLVEYDSVDQALDYINARPRPLALYLFSLDAALERRVLHGTVSGGVVLNDTIMHVAQDDLPFGGVGASGMGRYHAREGFATFSQMKPVMRQHRFNGGFLLRPPYGKRIAYLLRLMLRS